MYKRISTAMVFEWDERKNRRNRAKHAVSFEAATLVFEDPHAIGVPDHAEEEEERWKTVGMPAGGRSLRKWQRSLLRWRGCRTTRSI